MHIGGDCHTLPPMPILSVRLSSAEWAQLERRRVEQGLKHLSAVVRIALGLKQSDGREWAFPVEVDGFVEMSEVPEPTESVAPDGVVFRA